MIKILVIVCSLFILFNASFAQSPAPRPLQKGTIKVKKQGHLSKIVFDDVNYRLLGIDIYGNIMDTAVIEFKMFVTVKGIFYKTSAIGPNLSREMQEILERRDNRTIIYFKNIKAKDRNGTILNMRDFSYAFPYLKEDY
jgi:hypothetical protein